MNDSVPSLAGAVENLSWLIDALPFTIQLSLIVQFPNDGKLDSDRESIPYRSSVRIADANDLK
jgi:hypothetical protein